MCGLCLLFEQGLNLCTVKLCQRPLQAPPEQLHHWSLEVVVAVPPHLALPGSGKVHFADISDARVASAIHAGAYRFFCKDDDFSFLVDMA
jgi:hypothetical protein